MSETSIRRIAVWVIPTAIVLAAVIPLTHTDLMGDIALAVAVLFALAIHGLLRDHERSY